MEIKLNHISYSYDRKTKLETKALNNLNCRIKDKNVTCIVGPDDSGKTTISKILNLNFIPTTGEVKIDNTIVTDKNDKKILAKIKRQIGLITSETEVFTYKTVRKEIIEKKNIADEEIITILNKVGLDETYLNREPNSLSMSEKKKVSIVKVLIRNPNIIIFDEPTLYLNNNELLKLIRELKLKEEKTVVILSKDTDFVLTVADYVYIINNGKVLRKGYKYEVLSKEKLLNKHNLETPRLIAFSNLVKTMKNVKIGYRDDINDLMKDVYRYVR